MKLTISHRPLTTLLALICAVWSINAFSPNQFSSSSVLESGLWVKVKVTESGIHQFTDEQLIEMGFSDPEAVRVYGYGGNAIDTKEFLLPQVQATTYSSYPDDLPQILSMRYNDKLMFYGEAATKADMTRETSRLDKVSINHYADCGYYFLSDSRKPNTFSSIAAQSNIASYTKVNSHYVTQLLEYNDENPTMGGVYFYSPDILKNPIQFSFDIPDADESGNAYIGYKCVGKSTSGKSTFEVILPNELTAGESQEAACQRVTTTAQYSDGNGYQHFTLPVDRNTDGKYTFSITPIEPYPSYAAIDWVYCAYKRANHLGDRSQMRMVFPKPANSYIQLEDTKETIAVWDVTLPYYVRSFRFNKTEDKTTFYPPSSYSGSNSPSAMHAIAFDYANGTFPTPEVIGNVPNQSLHSMTAPNMVIITNKLCHEQALRLADAHARYQNFSVKVVTQEEIFNEFSSGTPNPMAIRYFAKMLWDRNPNKFRHLLFFGEACFDNIGYTHPGKDRLLSYQTDSYSHASSLSTNYTADTYFGILEDFAYDPNSPTKFPLNCTMNIAVGRIPASSILDATSAVDKIIDYLANPPAQPYRNRALLLADTDKQTADKFVTQTEELCELINAASPSTTITKSYIHLYPLENDKAILARSVIERALSQGQSYVCFTGHGKAAGLTANDLWFKSHVESTDYTYAPFWMLATCDSFSFDRLDDGIVENMLYKKNGGGIALVGSSRTVYDNANHTLSKSIAQAFFTSTPDETFGDIYRRGRNASIPSSSDDTRVNTLCYNFAGDPALPAHAPEYNIIATEVNGIKITEQEESAIYPNAENYISGAIIDSNGEVVTSFDGQAVISLFDGPTMTNCQYTVTNATKNVVRDEALLNEICVPVIGGYFTSIMVPPMPLFPETSNRISFFATSDDNAHRAVGYYNNAVLKAYDITKTIDDKTAPVIDQMYLDDVTFADGDEIGPTTILYATILPDNASGLDNSNEVIGCGATLKLDDSKSYPFARVTLSPQADGSATIKFPISNLSDGRHSLTLSVADNLGNRSFRTINFVVVNRNADTELICDKEAARDEATFDLRHSFASAPSGRIVIEDANGNTVFTKENCSFPYTWNLTNQNGEKVDDGLYRVSAIVKAEHQHSNTPKLNIVVIK